MNAGKHEIVLPSALYPFNLADLLCFEYGQFRLENVFRTITGEQRKEVETLWLESGIIGPLIARSRSPQVCYLMRLARTGQLVGVNTLYVDHLVEGQQKYFFNRMFIHPEHRGSRLMVIGTTATLCFAKTRLSSEGPPGVVTVIVNPKLPRPGMKRMGQRAGFRYQGRHDGKEVWYFDFESARMVEQDGKSG